MADELSLYVLSNQNMNSLNLQVDSIHQFSENSLQNHLDFFHSSGCLNFVLQHRLKFGTAELFVPMSTVCGDDTTNYLKKKQLEIILQTLKVSALQFFTKFDKLFHYHFYFILLFIIYFYIFIFKLLIYNIYIYIYLHIYIMAATICQHKSKSSRSLI